MDVLLEKIYWNILEGENKPAETNVNIALNAGLPAWEILEQGMIAAMAEVGRRYEAGEYYVPEMLISARAMQAGMGVLKPHLKASDISPQGRVAIGTVQGDRHDIGKNLVAMMLEGAGMEVLDLGTDVSPQIFCAAADRVDIIAISALLTTTLPAMQTAVQVLKAPGKPSRVKVMVGGAPVTEDFARQIGADGYAPDAGRAVILTKSLLGLS